MIPDKKIRMHLRCLLNDSEKLETGQQLADATNELTEIESDKKRVADDFKSKLSSAESEVAILSSKLRSGYEFRDVECLVAFDDPEPGKKTIYRTDIPGLQPCDGPLSPGEKVEVQHMSLEEIEVSQQPELPIQTEEPNEPSPNDN